MIAYASRTGTGVNLDAMRAAGWRILVSARGPLRTEGFPYAVDNGAWTAHQKGEPFNNEAFIRAVNFLAAKADFVVAPDVVCGGMGSLALSLHWLPWLRDRCRRILIPVQNGMEDEDLRPLLSESVGIFVGGNDLWKEQTAARWTALAHAHGAWCHVGRVNTKERFGICAAAGVDSTDGSSGSRFSVNTPKIRSWLSQTHAFGEAGVPFAPVQPRARVRFLPVPGMRKAVPPPLPTAQLPLLRSHADDS